MGFDNVDETAGMAPYLYPYDPSDPDNEMVADLNAFTGRIIGPSKLMSVREGETIDLSTNYWYHELPGENPISDLTEILAGILLNMGAASSGIISTGPEAGMALLNNVNGTQFNALSGFLDDAFDEVDLTDPQAYLVYMFFDKNNMKIISEKSGIIQVGEADQLGVISQKDLIMDRDGFFYVYVTNRSQLSVSFDNLEVKRWKPVVRVAYDYYPYGLTWENPALPGTEEGTHDCTYQDKEFQFGEFSDGHGLALYDFHARMYDGATGRWLVPDPAAQFANPYLAMGNNPVSGIDPDGCWSISSFIDNHDYEWQKRNLPLAIKITAPFGTEQRGFGFDASIGIPKNSSIGGRINLGATYYNKNYHNPKGWETRFGAEANLGRFLSVGTMHYASGESSQTTSVIQIGSTKKYFRYENDFMFGLPADNHDRFRTTGGIIKWGTLKVNLNLFTGTPGGPDSNHNPEASAYGIDDGKYVKNHRFGIRNDADYARIYNFNNGFDPDKYRDGVLSFQLGIFRIGRNSEGIRNAFQNQFAHDIILKGETPHFKILDIKPRWIFQIASGNGNSTW
jgi:RHS repeat-associated protein